MRTWTWMLLLFLLFQLFPTERVVACDGRVPGDWEVTVWELSKHLERPPEGHVFVEVNPGVGLRRYFSRANCWEIFADANYISKNSTGGTAALVGVGAQRPFASIGEKTELLVGGVAGMTRYDNRWEKKVWFFPGAYPYIGVRHRDVSVVVGYIPHISMKGEPVYETLFLYAGIKF